MALTEYDKKNLSKEDQAKIQAATDKWNAANANGDEAGKKAAAAEAAAVRNNAGYQTDSYGRYTSSYSPTTSGSSGGSSSKNSQYTGTNIDYGILGKQQMASGADWRTVLETYNNRYNKAMKNEGLEKYADDEIQQAMWNYITAKQQQGAQNQAQEWYDDYVEKYQEPTYEDRYDPYIDTLMDEILNRDDFSYDAESDPLYQQYAKMYQREGDRAMKETMAEAAASAGGMNSYAVTAAQQVANNYAAQLNDAIPELYQLAYEMYLADKESKIQDLGILQNASATQYNRYRDTMEDYKADRNFAYGLYQNDVANGQWQQQFDYNQAIDERDFNYNSAWANKQWDYNTGRDEVSDSRYDRDTAYEKAMLLMSKGQRPDAEMIAAAGLTEAYVDSYLKGIEAEKTGSGSSGGSSGSSGKAKTVKYNGYDDDDDDGDDDEPLVISDDADISNKKGDSWVYIAGKGRFSYDEIIDLIDSGQVTEKYNPTTNKYTYTWNNK